MRTTTTIVPIGYFTPALARRVRRTALQSAEAREVIISLQLAQRFSWSGLHDLAESLRAAVTPHPIRLARTLPRTRALLNELGIQDGWFVNDADIASATRIIIRENARCVRIGLRKRGTADTRPGRRTRKADVFVRAQAEKFKAFTRLVVRPFGSAASVEENECALTRINANRRPSGIVGVLHGKE